MRIQINFTLVELNSALIEQQPAIGEGKLWILFHAAKAMKPNEAARKPEKNEKRNLNSKFGIQFQKVSQ